MSNQLTFFAWGDTHFGYEQRRWGQDLRSRVIEQMNRLPGRAYPKAVGGVVDSPDFVVHCGDILDGGRPDGIPHFRSFLARLRWPHYEVIGNHDVAGEFLDALEAKYGGRSYSFDCRGIHFLSLAGVYDEREIGTIEPDGLEFLRRDLTALDSDTPVVLCTHCRLDCLANGEEVRKRLKMRRTILVVAAHKHRPAAFDLDGIACVDVGHCRNHPIDAEVGRSFAVVRISPGRITSAPWRWDLNDWERGQRWADPEATARRFSLERML